MVAARSAALVGADYPNKRGPTRRLRLRSACLAKPSSFVQSREIPQIPAPWLPMVHEASSSDIQLLSALRISVASSANIDTVL